MQQKGLIPHKKYQSFLSLKNTFTGQAIMKDKPQIRNYAPNMIQKRK